MAYQLVSDFNYASFINHSEMEFVVRAESGNELDGIDKFFSDLGDYNPKDVIKWMSAQQWQQFERLDINVQSLWATERQLIDCQNRCCKVDKYCSVAHPDIKGISGRSRIKQSFKPSRQSLTLFYPPKWQMNRLITSTY